MNSTPFFSIITPVFNASKTIKKTIESVIQQSNSDYEYIIVDACSNDGTSEIIKSYGNYVDFHICEKDEGIYDAMNKGIRVAKGNIVGIINADDFYNRDALSIIQNFDLKNNADIYYGDIEIFSSNKNYTSKPYNHNLLYWGMCLRHPACFVKKIIYQDLGSFDISYRIAADYDFLLRSFLAKKRFQYVPKKLAYFSNTGISNVQKSKSSYEQYCVRKKYNCLFPRIVFFVQIFYSKFLKSSIQKIIGLF